MCAVKVPPLTERIALLTDNLDAEVMIFITLKLKNCCESFLHLSVFSLYSTEVLSKGPTLPGIFTLWLFFKVVVVDVSMPSGTQCCEKFEFF